MRRHVTVFGICAALAVAAAPAAFGQVIFEETFGAPSGGTSDPLPLGWTTVNVDGLAPAEGVSYVTDAWVVREDFIYDPSDAVAFSTSWYTPAGAADDWAITPQIVLTTDNLLEWEAVAPDPAYPDGYEVWLSTTTPDVAGMTNLLEAVTAESDQWTAHSISLAAYAGQAVYIGFHNNSNDFFLLLLDDVRVRRPTAADAKVAKTVQPTVYTLVPGFQGHALDLTCFVDNNGTGDLTGVEAMVTAYLEGSPVHTEVFVIGGIPVGETATASFAAFAPSAASAGALTITYSVSHDGVDGNPSDNTRTIDGFYVNADTLGRDDGLVTGGLGIGAGEPDSELGAAFDILAPADLTEVVSYLTGAAVTETVSVLVRAMDGVNGTPGTLLASSYPFTPTDTAEQVVIFTFAAPVPLAAGSYYVGLLEDPTNTLQLGYTDDIFTPGTMWVNWPSSPQGGWAHVEDFGTSFAKTFVIRPILVTPTPAGAIFADDFESGDLGAWTTFTP